MAQISLKRLIDKQAAATLAVLVDSMATSVGVYDQTGTCLWGQKLSTTVLEDRSHKYFVHLAGEVIGWVTGEQGGEAIAAFLTYAAQKKLENKHLADEVLLTYREINLLYNLAERLGSCFSLETMAELALDEIRRLLSVTSASVMLLNEKTQTLHIVASFGSAMQVPVDTGMKPGQGIAGNVFLSGRGEIINHVTTDPRFVSGRHPVGAMISVPVKLPEKVLGVMNVSHAEPITYTASELKLMVAIAAQLAPAIESALVYQRQIEEAKAREEKLKQQLSDLRIEVDEVKRARQVAEITETDYFQQLQKRAKHLRSKSSPPVDQ